MGLFDREPIWRKDFSVYRIDKGHRERNKAIQYVRDKVNDDATLSRIILEAPDNEVKRTAIEKLADDQYSKIIPLYFRYGYTIEAIAETLGVEPRTISRNKKRLSLKIHELLG